MTTMNPYGTRRASTNASQQDASASASQSLSHSPQRQRRMSYAKQRRPSNQQLSVSPALGTGLPLSSSMPPATGLGSNGARKRSQSIGDDGEIKNATKKDKKDYFECEKCSKVYRHSTCLVKHRWEHTAHWKEASKLLLSKHQQVQLLEAAAILQVAGAGSSLPEDKSYWPAAVSPPSSGLLGSRSLNINVLHSSPHLFASRSLQPDMSAPAEEDLVSEDEGMDEDDGQPMTSSGTEDLVENMFEMDIDESTSDDSSRARSVGQDSGYYGSSVKSTAQSQAAPVQQQQQQPSSQGQHLQAGQPVLGFFPKSRPSPSAVA